MTNIDSLGSESPLVDWLSEHGKKLAWGFSALLLFLFLLFRLYSGTQAKAEKDFIEARKFETSLFLPAKAADALEKLEVLVQRHPSLQAEYDGLMAQAWLDQGKPLKAAPLVKRTEKRIASDSLSSFTKSADIALAISEGQLETAYLQATALKETLQSDKGVLYYFNLFRIGMLEQSLGKKEEEKKTWDELMKAAANATPAFQQWVDALDVPGASIVTFIQERQKRLN